MQNVECKIVVFSPKKIYIVGEADTIILHSAFIVLHLRSDSCDINRNLNSSNESGGSMVHRRCPGACAAWVLYTENVANATFVSAGGCQMCASVL